MAENTVFYDVNSRQSAVEKLEALSVEFDRIITRVVEGKANGIVYFMRGDSDVAYLCDGVDALMVLSQPRKWGASVMAEYSVIWQKTSAGDSVRPASCLKERVINGISSLDDAKKAMLVAGASFDRVLKSRGLDSGSYYFMRGETGYVAVYVPMPGYLIVWPEATSWPAYTLNDCYEVATTESK